MQDHKNFTICKNILSHCHSLFVSRVESGEIQLPTEWKMPIDKLGLYYYSDIEDLSYFVDDDISLLKRLGFHHDFENQLFFPWFKAHGIQLCPFDIETGLVERPKTGIVKNVPCFFKKIFSIKSDTSPVFVTSDPIDAMLLIANGHSAVALGSLTVLKGQVKYLAMLQRPLVFLTDNIKKAEQHAEIFIYAMNKFIETHIMFTNSVRDFVLSEQVDFDLSLSGIKFLAERIMKKKNGNTDYDRNIEIVRASQQLSGDSLNEFNFYIKGLGARQYSHFSQSLRLMADLIDSKLSINESRELTSKRYGVDVFIKELDSARIN